MLKLICAQSGRSLGRERKTDPTSSARINRKGLKDNNNRLLDIFNKFCIPFGTEIRISICGGRDSDCTVVTLHRFANFRARHLNLYVELTRRGIILIALLFILLVFLLPYRFSVKQTENRPVFRVKIVIFWSPHKSRFLRYRYFLKQKKALI